MRRKNQNKVAHGDSVRRSEKIKAAKERFVRDVLSRGKAVKPTGKDLPPGVTHEIVKDDGKNLPTIRRRRFSVA